MKFRITEGANKYTGTPIFYVYEWETSAISGEGRWAYRHGSGREQDCRDYIARAASPVAERIVDEIEIPTP
jgi:hypothetical protein